MARKLGCCWSPSPSHYAALGIRSIQILPVPSLTERVSSSLPSLDLAGRRVLALILVSFGKQKFLLFLKLMMYPAQLLPLPTAKWVNYPELVQCIRGLESSNSQVCSTPHTFLRHWIFPSFPLDLRHGKGNQPNLMWNIRGREMPLLKPL